MLCSTFSASYARRTEAIYAHDVLICSTTNGFLKGDTLAAYIYAKDDCTNQSVPISIDIMDYGINYCDGN